MAEGLCLNKFERPLSWLRPSTLAVLSQMLNPIKVIFTPTGHLRDWRGVAELMGSDILFIQNIENHTNPFASLIKQYASQFQVSDLLKILEEIDRYDVIDDSIKLIEQDMVAMPEQPLEMSRPSQDVPQLVTIRDFDSLNVNGTLPMFDAFVLFAEEDRDFVDLIIEKMEGEYGLKLCLKDRDLLPGLPFEHQAITQLISTRCNFVLPIFSPNFLKCSDNNFIVSFTEALGIERGCRKVIPCLYEPCSMPQSMSFYSRLDYTRSTKFWDFWDKMRKSIEHPASSTRNQPAASNMLPEKNEFQFKDSGLHLSSSKDKLGGMIEIQNSSNDSQQSLVSKSSEPQSWIKKLIPKTKKKKKKKIEAIAG